MGNTGQLAILIDGDNASPTMIATLLARRPDYRKASVKRVYGDWTSTRLSCWKEIMLEHALQPVQQLAYTKGKNATDISMVIDAMDLLHSGRFGAFCLVSSDSDFTALAVRVREQGLAVHGVGRSTTIPSFVAACDTFTSIEHPVPQSPVVRTPPPVKRKAAPVAKAATPAQAATPPTRRALTQEMVASLKAAVQALADKDGRARLSLLGAHLIKQSPDFGARKFGYARLSDLAKASGFLDVEPVGAQKTLMVRLKKKA